VAAAAAFLDLGSALSKKRKDAGLEIGERDGGVSQGGVSGPEIPRRISRAFLDAVNEWAFAAEVLMTGTPSGIDNTVSCYGGAVRFRKAPPPPPPPPDGATPVVDKAPLSGPLLGAANTPGPKAKAPLVSAASAALVEPLGTVTGVRMLLTNTKVSRETKVLVAKVANLRSSSPEMTATVSKRGGEVLGYGSKNETKTLISLNSQLTTSSHSVPVASL